INIPLQDGAGRAKKFNAVLKYNNECETYQMAEYVKKNSNQRWGDDIQNNLRILNAYINSDVRAQYLTHGRKQIFPKPEPRNRLFLPGGIELMLGFFQSIRPGWEKLHINIDICATTFYPSGPLIDLIPKILANVKSKDELRRGLNHNEIELLEHFLKGLNFTTTYRSTNNTKPKKKVSYITKKSAQNLMFNFEGQNLSVSQYFSNSETPLEFPMLPCVAVAATKRGQSDAYYPLEVCQKFKVKSLDKDQRIDMIKKTAIFPSNRFERITSARKNIYKHSENDAMKSISMEVENDYLTTISRVLKPPPLTCTPDNTEIIIPESGSWSVSKFITPARLHSWSVVCFDPKLKKEYVEAAMRCLLEVLIGKGLRASAPLKIMQGNSQNCKA
ncbi:4213_t:CDS:2, partial [Racocetra persica]